MGWFKDLFDPVDKNARTTRRQNEQVGYYGQLGYNYDPSRGAQNLADSGIYDQFGNTNQIPAWQIAPDVQYGANVVAMRRNDMLAQQGGAQAQIALNNGLQNLSSYRPGGAAALLSPYYQQQANTYFQTAMARRADAPDLMFKYDEKVRNNANKAAKQAGLVSAIGGLAGTALGALTGGAFAPNLNPGQQQDQGTQQAPGRYGQPNQYADPIGPPMAQGSAAGGGGMQQAPGGGQDMQGPYTSGASGGPSPGPQSSGGGGGGGGGPQTGGGKRMAPGAAPAPGGAGPQGAPSGGGAPPTISAMAARTGAEPALFGALFRQVFSEQPNIAGEFNARLSMLMARDVPMSIGA